MLTGTTPLHKREIQKQAYDELCRQIREVEAPKPSSRISTLKDAERSTIALQRQVEPKSLRQLLDGDLDIVVLKALAKDRDRRYETPKELATDVERFLNDEPVTAVPPSQLYLARKYFHRHRAAILTAAAFITSLVFATAFSTWQAVRAKKAKGDAVVAKQKAVASEQVATAALDREKQTADQRRRELYAANMQLAAQLWDSPNGDIRKVEELLTTWIPVDDSEDLREFTWRHQWNRLYKSAAVTVLETTGAAISRDGRLLTANHLGIHEWDDSGTRSVPKWKGVASDIVFSPDGRWAAIKHLGETQLIEIATGQSVIKTPHQFCSFSTRGELFAAWTPGTKTVLAWDLSGQEPSELDSIVLPGQIPLEQESIQLSDDRRSLLVRGYPTYLSVTLLSDDAEPVSWQHRSRVASTAWSPNGELLVTGGGKGILHLRLRNAPHKMFEVSSHGKKPHFMRFSPDGSSLAVGASDGTEATVYLWDTSALLEFSKQRLPSVEGETENSLPESARPKLQLAIKAHLSPDHFVKSGGIQSLAFSADGHKLVSRGYGVTKLWDLVGEKGRYDVADFGDDLYSGRLGLTCESTDQGVKVVRIDSQRHDVESGEIRVGDRITGLSESNGRDIADLDQMVTDGRSNAEIRNARVDSLLMGPHRSVVQLTVEGEEEDRREVELRRSHKEKPRPIRICFSPEGETLAIADRQHGTSSINLRTGQSQRYPDPTSNSVAISGGLLAMDSLTDVLTWDLRKDEQHTRLDARLSIAPLPTAVQPRGAVAFSPEGTFLAIGTGDPLNVGERHAELRVWRTTDMQEVAPHPLFENYHVFPDIEFSPDGAYLIVIDHSGIVRIWSTKTWELLDRQFEVGRSLAVHRHFFGWQNTGHRRPKRDHSLGFRFRQETPCIEGPRPLGHRLFTGWQNVGFR